MLIFLISIFYAKFIENLFLFNRCLLFRVIKKLIKDGFWPYNPLELRIFLDIRA